MNTIPKPTLIKTSVGIALLLVAFAAGFMLRGGKGDGEAMHDHAMAGEAAGKNAEVWTCSMHPQIRLPKPGKCPICFMDLIPLDLGSGEEGGLRELSVSENSAKLMEIETVAVERRFVTADVRMVGKVDYDETRVSHITAWVPGRLDRLFVDYTGVAVKKGHHMVTLYSPELLGAQEELLQAINAAKQLENSDVSIVRDTTESTVAAVREKLRLWGLTPEQIKEIERRGKPDDHVTIYAPAGGIVIQKNAQEGMYVNTGTRIYTIADLSQVWISLAAYESDLAWLRYGQRVQFTTESYPGEVFTGSISFIHPVLNEATRTVKVRVNVPNEDGRLKPGMFVRAVAEAEVATGGRVMDAALAGKWISPMHPEVVKDGPGTCDVCGMPLVRAESLGYVGSEPAAEDKPLVIPASAALLTGKRAVVYVEVPGRERPTFEGREVVLGARAGDDYLVREGLDEGERVVTRGAFKIDAELQIRAKPSMMTPAPSAKASSFAEATADRSEPREGGGGGEHAHHGVPAMQAKVGLTHGGHAGEAVPTVSPEFKKQLDAVIEGYLAVQAALAKDDHEAARESAKKALEVLAKVDMGLVTGKDHMDWMKKHAGELKSLLAAVAGTDGIEPAREKFALLSEQVVATLSRFGVPEGRLYKAWCPMAFDNRGASWIQDQEEINNPYFGGMMLRCGEIKEVLE